MASSDYENQQLEIYLGKYVSYIQDDWARWLPAVEFANSNYAFTSTRSSPFLATFGHELPMSLTPVQVAPETRDVDALVERKATIYCTCKEEITRPQAQK